MIICAAIKVGDTIIRGHRHHNCIRVAVHDFKMTKEDLIPIVYGFINSDNKFVTRIEAKEEFEKCGQGIGKWHEGLYSEDLY